MGLTNRETGAGILKNWRKAVPDEKAQGFVTALAGNPNVGKSTVFNGLTGLNQHTGNWPGKTVASARGSYRYNNKTYTLVDIPGTYSLMANSAEEEIARNFICFGRPDVTVVVVDATCLERNLNLVLQTTEITGRVVVCVNLLDEAKKKKIHINLPLLSKRLGVPVVGTSARSGKGLDRLMETVHETVSGKSDTQPLRVVYDKAIEDAVSLLIPTVEAVLQGGLNSRWVALKLLDADESLIAALNEYLGRDILQDGQVAAQLAAAKALLAENGLTPVLLRDSIVTSIVKVCEQTFRETVTVYRDGYNVRDHRLDKILTSKLTGIPIMLLLLFGVFWLTITGANYPSELLATGFFKLQEHLNGFFTGLSAPEWLTGLVVDGVYKTLAWVISVMLPPMAIFFPLFTLLEDSGYLPRIAFNLDNVFRKACAHGKQALTMCMGFGCNACGVIGCRIIESPRERMIAILTNNFVPCNGRFPTLIAIITMFFAGVAAAPYQSVLSTLLLTGVIVLGVMMTLAVSRLLSKTILKGLPSSFNLELPPYRRPQIGKIIVRSVLDRTLFVLGRAVMTAAPAGLIIWGMANLQAGGVSLLTHCANFLQPLAHLMGMDGYILLAFILGFPANEIVVPIIIMSYLSTGSLTDFSSLADLHTLLLNNGWTWLTAVCVMLFSLMHWPCATTCLTIKKETKSLRWTFAAFAIPTALGMVFCIAVAGAARLLGLA